MVTLRHLSKDELNDFLSKESELNINLNHILVEEENLAIYAIKSENPELIQKLVDRGLEFRCIDKKGHDIFNYLDLYGSKEDQKTVEDILEKAGSGGVINLDPDQIEQYLRDHPFVDVNNIKIDGDPLFNYACEFRKSAIAKECLKRNANPNLLNKDGENVLICAVSNIDHSENYEIIKSLLESKKANPNSCTREGKSALVIASINNDPKTINILLNHGAEDFIVDPRTKYKALDYAIIDGNFDCAKLLIDKGKLTNKDLEHYRNFAKDDPLSVEESEEYIKYVGQAQLNKKNTKIENKNNIAEYLSSKINDFCDQKENNFKLPAEKNAELKSVTKQLKNHLIKDSSVGNPQIIPLLSLTNKKTKSI